MANRAFSQPTDMMQPALGFRSWFACTAGCSGELPLNQIIYYCPKCGSLLDVHHDLTALRRRSSQEWKHLFDDRYCRTAYPYGSGVWGKKEMVLPNIPDEDIVSLDEGGTNLFSIDYFDRVAYLAQRAMREHKERVALRARRALVESAARPE